MSDERDEIEFDEGVALALAAAAGPASPSAGVKERLMGRIRDASSTPAGFHFVYGAADDWMPHPVPGIRMKILAHDKRTGVATLLLDVAPGTRFPPHHHGGAEECYVVSGSLFTCGRRLDAGDFVHADADTDHGELRTDEGCRVILVVPADEHLPQHMLQ